MEHLTPTGIEPVDYDDDELMKEFFICRHSTKMCVCVFVCVFVCVYMHVQSTFQNFAFFNFQCCYLHDSGLLRSI